tara:strand:+ start:2107 stop:2508 length:402 start_codon:yes stop_codon:yes gene_type:complete
LARHVASAPFATTRKRLLSAVVTTAMLLTGVAVVAGVFRDFQMSLDMLMGAAVILVPSVWVAVSLTSGRSVISPIWMGLARYSLATVGFAMVFALRPQSSPVAVLAGSALALLLPPLMVVWHQRRLDRTRDTD